MSYPHHRLDDDKWHSVLVERNRKEAMVVVDGARKGQVKEPRGPVRPMLLNADLYVGAKGDLTDGFVGCMRALVLNGVVVDLLGEARKGLYGVGEGCVGKCASKPCMNGGECHEQYSQFECDCRWTPFKVRLQIQMVTHCTVRALGHMKFKNFLWGFQG